MHTYETPTGAADNCLLEFDGGVAGTLKVRPETNATWARSHADEREKAMVLIWVVRGDGTA